VILGAFVSHRKHKFADARNAAQAAAQTMPKPPRGTDFNRAARLATSLARRHAQLGLLRDGKD